MQDHSQGQASAEPRALIVGDSESSVVQTDVLQEKAQAQPGRPVVKVGHQLEF
jgi:hypothetical protein